MSSATVFSVSVDKLEYELAQAELALQHQEAATNRDSDTHDSSHPEDSSDNDLTLNPLLQLSGLNQSTNDLLLAQDVTQWMKECRTATDEHNGDTSEDDPSWWLQHSRHFHSLGEILLQHRTGSLHREIWEREYDPMIDYLQHMLLRQYQSLLKSAGYPQQCPKILQEWEENTPQFQQMVNTALWLYKLQVQRPIIKAHVNGQSAPPAFQSTNNSIVTELCRPFVERIRHHFVKTMEPDRVERLPEWIFAYIKENIFPSDQDGPWDVVHYAFAPIIAPNTLATDFVNEIVTLCQYVFSQHNLFRHDRIVNANNPQNICSIIQQLIEMDDFLAKTVHKQANRVLSFMDLYVANDDELFQWWIDRERESFLDDLFYGLPESDCKENVLSKTRIHPRAELFTSLIQSIQYKASVFQFSGPYLHHVASPLCVRFMEAVQESATDLKRSFFAGTRTQLPPLSSWKNACGEWMALLNGVHLSADQILHTVDERSTVDANNPRQEDDEHHHDRSSARSDLQGFGHSLRKFESVLVEEFGRLFIEKLLMEKAGLSSYLVQCSQLLATPKSSPLKDPSPLLLQSEELLRAFLQVVQEPTSPLRPEQDILWHAARQLRDEVLTNLSLKFLEVLLNWHGIDDGNGINSEGMELISSHVELMFGQALLPHTAMRLRDVCKLILDRGDATALMDALCGLAGQPAPPLEIDSFVLDDRILEEATSMLRAKKYLWLELQDALLIINRRLPDLNPMLQFAAY